MMDGHISERALRTSEQEDGTIVEKIASDFAALSRILALYEQLLDTDVELSITRAREAAQRGVALCYQLIREANCLTPAPEEQIRFRMRG